MNLKREDLIQPCQECDGKGKIPEKPISGGSFGFRSTSYSLMPGLQKDDCRQCWGTGKILTDDGLLILEVLEVAKKQNKIDIY